MVFGTRNLNILLDAFLRGRCRCRCSSTPHGETEVKTRARPTTEYARPGVSAVTGKGFWAPLGLIQGRFRVDIAGILSIIGSKYGPLIWAPTLSYLLMEFQVLGAHTEGLCFGLWTRGKVFTACRLIPKLALKVSYECLRKRIHTRHMPRAHFHMAMHF